MTRVVVVTGGRDLRDRVLAFAALDALHALEPFSLLIEGGQRTYEKNEDGEQFCVGGADWLAKCWAGERRVPCRTMNADWNRHGTRAGPLRNQEMIDEAPDLVVAFPGGRGTADCVRRALAANIPVSDVIVRPQVSV